MMKRKIINSVIKDTVTFLQTSSETNSMISEIECTLMPKGKNFPHYHKTFTETFTAIDGALGLKLGGNKTRILQPTETYTVQKNQVHSFFNPGNSEIRFNVKITPGHEGFEQALRILYGLAEDGFTNKKSVPKSLQHIAIIGNLSDSYLPGLMKILSPMFDQLAKKGRRNGIERALIERYCR